MVATLGSVQNYSTFFLALMFLGSNVPNHRDEKMMYLSQSWKSHFPLLAVGLEVVM